MTKTIQSLIYKLRILFCGMTTFSIYQNSDYAQHNTPEQMMRLSWKQTGQRLSKAIDDYKKDDFINLTVTTL